VNYGKGECVSLRFAQQNFLIRRRWPPFLTGTRCPNPALGTRLPPD